MFANTVNILRLGTGKDKLSDHPLYTIKQTVGHVYRATFTIYNFYFKLRTDYISKMMTSHIAPYNLVDVDQRFRVRTAFIIRDVMVHTHNVYKIKQTVGKVYHATFIIDNFYFKLKHLRYFKNDILGYSAGRLVEVDQRFISAYCQSCQGDDGSYSPP